MGDAASTPRSQRRLVEELEDDEIDLTADTAVATAVVEELDYTRRIPMFEGRRPVYGAIIPDPDSSLEFGDFGVDVVEAPVALEQARTYADGRFSYLIRDPSHSNAPIAVACFDRPVQYESDVVLLQKTTGALIVQRTAVLGVTRLFQPNQVVSWNGRSWTGRPTAGSLVPKLSASMPELGDAVAQGLLELVFHWLSPARCGATLVIHANTEDDALRRSLETSSATEPPMLSLTNRRHFPPLLSSLMQRDLAVLVDAEGTVRMVGLGLMATEEAHTTITPDRGMRHRSAQRWSFDQPDAIVAVVSEDGPVTIYRAGAAVIGNG